MRIYGLKNCDTCRKALRDLNAQGNDATLIDVRETPLAAETRNRFWHAFGAALLNTRSTTWRGLSEAERTRAPLDLIAEHPTLMKRPVIEKQMGSETKLYIGWGAQTQSALLSN